MMQSSGNHLTLRRRRMTVMRLSANLMLGASALMAVASPAWIASQPASAVAAEPAIVGSSDAASNLAIERQVEALVAKLTDENFSIRDEARRKLETLATAEESAAAVRRIIEARLAVKSGDWESRATLEAIRRRLPQTSATAINEPAVAPEAIDAVFRELESDKFAVREAAAERLRPLAEKPATCALVMDRIKRRLDEPKHDVESIRRLAPLWTKAWSTWLTNPTADAVKPPPVDDAAIAAQIDRLLAPLPRGFHAAHALLSPHAAAERELLYLLARDDTFERTRDALTKRMENAEKDMLDLDTFERLQKVYDWSRPAMVAEFWQQGEQRSLQHLLIGVPNQPVGAANPSLFDRCDEKFAHCVSGNSLTPGDWPVGVFFPHPSDVLHDAQFHLKNLPTPRRRLAYEYEVPTTLSRERQVAIDSARRKPITRRTCERLLELKRPLVTKELDMLDFLDPEEVSKFVGPYLQGTADVRTEVQSLGSFGNGSVHGDFCYKISAIGTATAGPALAAAIEKQRVLEPTEDHPFRMDWLSLLVLTDRVEWPGCDEWLAAQVDKTDAIKLNDPKAATVGASCAALLLRRHGRVPSEFGLQQHSFAELVDLENPGFRFNDAGGAKAVKSWWQQLKESERKAAP
jgi:hypothetical protein